MDIKNISRDDTLAVHRVPPQPLGGADERWRLWQGQRGGRVFVKHEIEPLQRLDINEQVGEEAVPFRHYEPIRISGASASAAIE